MFNFLGKLGFKAEASKVGEKLESIKFSHGSPGCQVCLFYELVWPVLLAQVFTASSTDFSFQNLVFWKEFENSAAEIT
jgi:hypothetical protein